MKLNVATEAKPRLAVRPGRCRPYNKRLVFARPSGRLLSPGWPAASLGLYLVVVHTAAGRLLDPIQKRCYLGIAQKRVLFEQSSNLILKLQWEKQLQLVLKGNF